MVFFDIGFPCKTLCSNTRLQFSEIMDWAKAKFQGFNDVLLLDSGHKIFILIFQSKKFRDEV